MTDETLSESLLKEGKKVKLRVRGVSMLPILRPQDCVTIEPLPPALSLGEILLCKKNSGELFLHRLVQILDMAGSARFVLRGDGISGRQDTVSQGELLGRAVWVERRGKQYPLSPRRPSKFRRPYIWGYYGFLRLWLWWKRKI